MNLKRQILTGCLVVVCGLATAGCAGMPVNAPPDFPLSSPRQTTRYLQWAWTRAAEADRPRHVYNCLSDGFLTRNKISLGDVEFFWTRVRETIERHVGDVGGVEVVAERRVDDRHVEVDYRSGGRRATVLFVLQTTWEMSPSRRGAESVSGTSGSMSDVLSYQDGDAVLRLQGVPRHYPPEDLYQVRLDNQWKIHEVLRHDLPEVESDIQRPAPPGSP